MRNSAPIGAYPAPSVFRQLSESVVLLALAVVLFRAFAAEGYLISTGSMAPCLLGYHKQVNCPCCHYQFARGAAFDADSTQDMVYASGDGSFLGWAHDSLEESTSCPNCGWSGISVADVPRNEGDQLLVHKNAYEFRDPRRWEVIVFQNAADPQQAYCKRVVGLPNEHIAIRDGDIYADGQLQQKPYVVQKAIRIPFWDNDFQPDSGEHTQPRWQPADDGGWESLGTGFRFYPENPPTALTTSWLGYRHWTRFGGSHLTHVRLPNWPHDVPLPDGPNESLRYSSKTGRLTVKGVLSPFELQRWQNRSDDPDWQAALETLALKSHYGRIEDAYGYNVAGVLQTYPVHDLMLEFELTRTEDAGRVEVEMTDGHDRFTLVLDFVDGEAELLANGDAVPVRHGHFPASLRNASQIIEMSTFDRQVIVAVDGHELFAPWPYEQSSKRKPLQQPVRIGAAGGEFTVQHLKLYRDVYYTPKGETDEHPLEQSLGDDEFYVLGDNSPVSVDSRVWDDPAVRRTALIGKPLVVHLPSQQGTLKWGGEIHHVRIPDFSRVRYIR
ncbi:MAG: signal peptidase I [Planctomycetaceae bacterium]|nr:signal peptidase I [Planctomycetaceae bacterium]